ncbi:MAG: AsmA family protein [Alphaproteobacteria bacterium]|nr:AsmA family protein [Alphaproteobacteria bacterium]NCT06544.1 AsmA family protein [Alphaproteobacteria bacterium]
MRLILLKFLKYLGTTFLALSVFILILPYFVSLNAYKEEIISKAKEALGRDLAIDGNIKFRILPRPYVKIKDIKLSSPSGYQKTTLASVKEVEAILSIAPLFVGKIEVAKLVLDQPTISLEKLKNGKGNWEFDLKNKEASLKEQSQASQGTAVSTKPSPFHIKTIKIQKASLNYTDGENTTEVQDIDLTLDIEDLKGPINFSLDFNAFDTPFEITGHLKEIGSQIPLEAKLKALGEKLIVGGIFDTKTTKFTGDLELKGTLKNLKRFLPDIEIPSSLKEKYTLKADINATADQLSIHNLDFDLKPLKATGDLVVDLKKTTGALNISVMPGALQLELRPDVSQNNQFSGTISLKAGDISQLCSALKLKTKDVPPSLLKTFSFATHLTYQDRKIALRQLRFEMGAAELDGQITLENQGSKGLYSFDLKTRNIEKLTRLFEIQLPGNIGPIKFTGTASGDANDLMLDFSVDGAKAHTKIKGRLQKKDKSLKPALTLTTSGKSLRSTLSYLGQEAPSKTLGSFSVTTEVSGDIPQRVKLDFHKSSLTVGSDQVNIKGIVELFLSGLKPKINANLSLSALNLDRLLAVISPPNTQENKQIRLVAKNAPDKSQAPKTRWSHDKIDLAFLRSFEGDITIFAPALSKGSLVFDTVKMTARVANGILELTSLTGNLYGGSLTLKGRLSSQKDQPVALTAHLKDAQLKNIIPKQKEIKVLKGLFSLDADLTSQGKSEYQYVANLSGSMNFKGTKGTISGFDLQRIVKDLANVKSLGSALTLLNTSFSGGQTAFNSIDCITSVSKGEARIKKFLLDAVGADVTADGTVNLLHYLMDISSKITLEAKDFPPFAARIYGPLDNPKHELKTGKLEQYLINNVLTDVLDNLSKGKGGAEDIIKGVLGLGSKEESPSQQQPDKTQEKPTKSQKEIEAIGNAVGGLLKDLF